MNQALEQEFREKTLSKEQAAALVQSGQGVYIGCCTSYARAIADAIAARSEELEGVTIGCSNIIPPMSFLDCANPGAFHICTYFMGYEERRAWQKGRADFTSFHLGQVDQWCRETFHPDIAFFDVSLPDEEGYMSFGASGVCMHPFIQEETDNIVLQINRFAPYVTGSGPRSTSPRPSTWCGPTRRRRPSPAAPWRPTGRPRPWPSSSWTRSPTGPASNWASAGCPMRWGTALPPRTTWAATRRSCRTPSWP